MEHNLNWDACIEDALSFLIWIGFFQFRQLQLAAIDGGMEWQVCSRLRASRLGSADRLPGIPQLRDVGTWRRDKARWRGDRCGGRDEVERRELRRGLHQDPAIFRIGGSRSAAMVPCAEYGKRRRWGGLLRNGICR